MFYEKKEDYFFAVKDYKSLQYPLHVHQYIEYVRVEKGLLEMQIGKETYLIQEGDAAVIFPNITHDYHTLSTTGNTQLNIINGYLDLLPLHKKLLLSKYPLTPVIRKEDLHEDVLFAEKRLFEIRMKEENHTLISSFLSLMLCQLFPKLQLTDYQNQPPQDLVCEIIAYIASHFQEELTLTSVANHFGIGKYHLSRIFSNVLGIHFTAYLNALRMNYAKYLLHNSDMNITTIAIECGYHNQQTFNRIFKERNKCTPKEYKKSNFSENVPIIIH